MNDVPRPTFERPERPERPVRLRGRSGAPRVPFAVLLGTLLLGGMALLLLLNTASAANELRRQHYAEADQSVGASVQQLRNEVAASGAPENLARAAAALGMVPAGNPAFLVVGADGKVVLRGSAAPASEIPVQVPAAKPKPKTSTKTTKSKAKPKPTSTPTGTPTSKPTGTPTSKATSKPTSKATHASSTPKPRSTRTGGTR